MQQLLKKLSDHSYIDILWAHPASIDLLHAFPRDLIMDCTYNTNMYMLLLMEIFGVTSTEMTFSIAFAYLETEREDNFSWCLDSMRLLVYDWQIPPIIVTDRDLTCINAVEKIFPESHYFLRRWHIRKKYSYSVQEIF